MPAVSFAFAFAATSFHPGTMDIGVLFGELMTTHTMSFSPVQPCWRVAAQRIVARRHGREMLLPVNARSMNTFSAVETTRIIVARMIQLKTIRYFTNECFIREYVSVFIFTPIAINWVSTV